MRNLYIGREKDCGCECDCQYVLKISCNNLLNLLKKDYGFMFYDYTLEENLTYEQFMHELDIFAENYTVDKRFYDDKSLFEQHPDLDRKRIVHFLSYFAYYSDGYLRVDGVDLFRYCNQPAKTKYYFKDNNDNWELIYNLSQKLRSNGIECQFEYVRC